MFTIFHLVILLLGLWGLKKTLGHLFKTFRVDYQEVKAERLKKHSNPSTLQILIESIIAIFPTMIRSPGNFLFVSIWLALILSMASLVIGTLIWLGYIVHGIVYLLGGGR